MDGTIDLGELKQVALGFCLETSYDLWEVLDEIEKNLPTTGTTPRRQLLDLAKSVTTDLVTRGCMDAFVREGHGMDELITAGDAVAALAEYANWGKPVRGVGKAYSLATTEKGHELFNSKRLLTDPNAR